MTGGVELPDGRAGARAVLVLCHGRGGGPEDMRALADALAVPGVACVAPAAPGGSWYPRRFIEPRAANEPRLSQALATVAAALDAVAEAGVDARRVVLGGFSQGACLACDALAGRPRPIGALAVLCGGLIGADDDELARPPAGALEGLPVLLTGIEEDAWVPVERVRRSGELLRAAGARVDERVHPPAPHGVLPEDVAVLRAIVAELAA